MGVYVVKNGQPWWTGLAGTVAGHLIDGMFQRDKAYRQQKKADANYDAFYNDLYGDLTQQQTQAQPKGLISGTIDAQLQRDITPSSYEPITVDQMNQNAPATGVFSNLGSGIVSTPPSANVSINVPAQTQVQPAASAPQGLPYDQRFFRALKHLHLNDPTALIKMAAEPILKNDAAFQHAQRVSNAVGDFPVGGTADEQTAFFAKNLPYYGDQGTNLAKVYDTAHPGYQMNVVDNGDRKDAVTLDKFSGAVKNPLTMKQGLNPDKQAANMAKIQSAAMHAAASKYGADQRAAAQNFKTAATLSKDQALILVKQAAAAGKIKPEAAKAFETKLVNGNYSNIPEAALRQRLGI